MTVRLASVVRILIVSRAINAQEFVINTNFMSLVMTSVENVGLTWDRVKTKQNVKRKSVIQSTYTESLKEVIVLNANHL